VDLVHTRFGVDGRGAVPLPSRTQTQKSHVSRQRGYTTLPTPVPILYVQLLHAKCQLTNRSLSWVSWIILVNRCSWVDKSHGQRACTRVLLDSLSLESRSRMQSGGRYWKKQVWTSDPSDSEYPCLVLKFELTCSSSSQPWPYPANLMVGCFGRAKPDQTIRLDLDNELEGMPSICPTRPVLIIRCPILPPVPHCQASRNGSWAIPLESRHEATRQKSDRQGS